MVLMKLKLIKVTELFYFIIVTLNIKYLNVIQITLLNGQYSFI